MNPEYYYPQDALTKALLVAVQNDDIAGIRSAVKRGALVNAEGVDDMRPLYWALAKNKLAAFDALLEFGADPNVSISAEDPMAVPVSVMGLCAIAERQDYLASALRHGGDPNFLAPGYDKTIIFDAIMNHRFENVRILVKGGANLSAKDSYGRTPLLQAGDIGDFKIVDYLLANGSDPTATDRWGYDLARSMKKFGSRGFAESHEQLPYYRKTEAYLRARGLY